MTTSTPKTLIQPQLTRQGLNRLLDLHAPQGLKGVITHVGLTSEAFSMSDELTAIPNEIGRWAVLDGERINATQHNLYIEYPYEGNAIAVRGWGFYLSDGTLLCTYADAQAEVLLSRQWLLDSIVHLVLDGSIPNDSIEVINTGIRFNPGVRETLLELMTQSLDKQLQITQLQHQHHDQQQQIAAANEQTQQLNHQIHQNQQAFDFQLAHINQQHQQDYEQLASHDLLLATHLLDLRLEQQEAQP